MRKHLLSIIRMREYLLKEGESGKNAVKCYADIRKMRAWLSAYPHATEQQVRAYAERHHHELLYLAPSGRNPAHLSIIEKLNTLIHEPTT